MNRLKDGRINSEIIARAKKIKAIFMDVDGVLTAGMIVYDGNGLEIKHFNAHDGLGVKLANLSGFKTGLISARESGTIRKRAQEIGLDYLYLGQKMKIDAFNEVRQKLNLPAEAFCFIGDDLPDVPVMRQAGLAVAVRNANEIVKQFADYVTQKNGGDGAVREVVEIILDAQNLLQPAIEKIWNGE